MYMHVTCNMLILAICNIYSALCTIMAMVGTLLQEERQAVLSKITHLFLDLTATAK